MLRRGSAGSNTAADHTAVTDAAIAALPPGLRRKLMITVQKQKNIATYAKRFRRMGAVSVCRDVGLGGTAEDPLRPVVMLREPICFNVNTLQIN